MILQALTNYYETLLTQGKITPPGWAILVESDELSEGDLIVVTRLTSTQTGSDSQGSGGFGGGFPGGMDFSDFDFGNFDPSTMPQGGNFPGMGS